MAGELQATYSALVIEHFDTPRNAGRLATVPGVIEAEAGSHSQGTQFHLSARISDSRLSTMRFEAYGCPHCIAAGSWLTQRLGEATRDDLMRWSWREAAEALDIPPEKRGHLLVLEDAVRRLAEAWRARG